MAWMDDGKKLQDDELKARQASEERVSQCTVTDFRTGPPVASSATATTSSSSSPILQYSSRVASFSFIQDQAGRVHLTVQEEQSSDDDYFPHVADRRATSSGTLLCTGRLKDFLDLGHLDTLASTNTETAERRCCCLSDTSNDRGPSWIATEDFQHLLLPVALWQNNSSILVRTDRIRLPSSAVNMFTCTASAK